MKLTRKHLLVGFLELAGIGIAAVIGISAIFLHVVSGESGTPSNKESAMKVTMEWGRLAPFPASARDLTITTKGNMFNRSFRVSFTAPAADIEH